MILLYIKDKEQKIVLFLSCVTLNNYNISLIIYNF